MDLRKFVSETLSQIALGVRDAQASVVETGAIVNPANYINFEGRAGSVESFHPVLLVDFDVAVSTNESTSTGAGASLSVVSFASLKAGGESSNALAASNRIAFKVPMALPLDQTTGATQRDKSSKTHAQLKYKSEF